MDILRFSTAGSVDDGKSTLIGRLFYDSKSIFEDQMLQIEQTSKKRGSEIVNLAYLTDGLKDELEQGITIDVAYRYFSTPKRKFIIADTPGHIQYTRNMVTGASSSQLALILIDARNGISEQTKRHSLISSLLGIKHFVICINKMDLVDFKQSVYEKIVSDYENFAAKLRVSSFSFIPISALLGDNVVTRSAQMPWYQGSTLFNFLETVSIASDQNLIDSRFSVQNIIRPNTNEWHDFRGIAGMVLGGVFRKGDEITCYPSGFKTKIKDIYLANEQINQAISSLSCTFLLEDDIDVSRGDMLVKSSSSIHVLQEFDVMLCWMGDEPLSLSGKYILKHTTNETKAMIKELKYKMDVHTLSRDFESKEIARNDIAKISLKTAKPIFFDKYYENRLTGSCILIDIHTNITVGACMIV
ncbi:MAG: GTP-binding protein [Chitinophagales bacterium]|jgi:sulfate adenylyltransferase subunit 1|nr:GTP-binding protein [Chitinophagales bacterium]